MLPLRKPSAKRIKTVTRNARDRFFKTDTMVVAGQLPYDLIHTEGLAQVRHYQALTEAEIPFGGTTLTVAKHKHTIPVVIVSPLAVNMLIYDLFPNRSFIKYLLAHGHDVYLIDWGKPSLKNASQTVSTYVKDWLPKCIEAVKQDSGAAQVSLHGWSMGGMLAALYAASSEKNDVRNLITLGTPVDGYANGAMGRNFRQLNKVMKLARLNLRKLPAPLAYAPGWVNVIGFKLLDPVSSIKGYLNLAMQLENRQYVEQHANQAAFIDNLEAYPGAVIRDWTASIWLENETAKGRFTVGRDVVHLERITANLLCIAGRKDSLSNIPCCKAMMPLVSSTDKEFFIGAGGHIGILAGREATATIWPKTADWLATRSDA
jgi:polyhydroxyalkanoate synthase